MDYMKERAAFKSFLLNHQLSVGAVSLWRTLFDICFENGGEREISTTNAMLGLLSGLSRQGILDARNSLIAYGLLRCENGTRGKSPMYELVSLVKEENVEAALDTALDVTLDTALDTTADIIVFKEREEEEEEDVQAFFEKNIASLAPYAKTELLDWVTYFGDAVVLEAIRLAAKYNGRTYRYVEKILLEWQEAGLRSLSDVHAHQQRKTVSRQTVPLPEKNRHRKRQALFDTLREEYCQ